MNISSEGRCTLCMQHQSVWWVFTCLINHSFVQHNDTNTDPRGSPNTPPSPVTNKDCLEFGSILQGLHSDEGFRASQKPQPSSEGRAHHHHPHPHPLGEPTLWGAEAQKCLRNFPPSRAAMGLNIRLFIVLSAWSRQRTAELPLSLIFFQFVFTLSLFNVSYRYGKSEITAPFSRQKSLKWMFYLESSLCHPWELCFTAKGCTLGVNKSQAVQMFPQSRTLEKIFIECFNRDFQLYLPLAELKSRSDYHNHNLTLPSFINYERIKVEGKPTHFSCVHVCLFLSM